MKLSPSKKFGFTHVKAARVLRVAQDHSLSTYGYDPDADYNLVGGGHDPMPNRFQGREWVFCKKGDLVIEVVKVKKRKLVGYSYLTGEAIHLMNYKAKPEYFEEDPIKVGVVDIPLTQPDDPKEAAKTVIDNMAKSVAENDICLLVTTAQDEEDSRRATSFLSDAWRAAEGDAHLIGEILFAEDQSMHFHFQPEEHAGALFINNFQSSLLFYMVMEKGKGKR